jgi:hypothetical protein
MPGHFEVYPRKQDHRRRGGGRYAWRFVDEHGKHTGHSRPKGFRSPGEAKLDVARFVAQVRQATYGLRFDAELADAVREVDE